MKKVVFLPVFSQLTNTARNSEKNIFKNCKNKTNMYLCNIQSWN